MIRFLGSALRNYWLNVIKEVKDFLSHCFEMKNLVVALSAPQKPYHPSPVQDSKGAVSEAYCPDLRCTPQAGMGKNVAATQCSGTCGERKKRFWCVSLRGATSHL